MTEFADALRRAFPDRPFTAQEALADLKREDVPVTLQHVIYSAEHGRNVHPVKSMGRHLLNAGAVRAGKTRDGAILWTAPPVL